MGESHLPHVPQVRFGGMATFRAFPVSPLLTVQLILKGRTAGWREVSKAEQSRVRPVWRDCGAFYSERQLAHNRQQIRCFTHRLESQALYPLFGIASAL